MATTRRARRLARIGAAGAGALAALLAATVVTARQIEPRLHAALVAALEAQFDSTVTLETLAVSVWPTVRLEGRGLVLRYQGRTDLPPLLVVHRFSGETSWRSLWAQRIEAVAIDGLELTIPPRRGEDMPPLAGSAPPPGEAADAVPAIGRVDVANMRLMILSRRPDAAPKVFDIFRLTLHDIAPGRTVPFDAAMTNPVPAGRIETVGRLGPWQSAEPSLTPLEGRFAFTADLATIHGIGGALDASGVFGGVLERITARGSTRTPDFRLPTLTGTPVPLETTFDAIIDGTTGDVYLERVDALVGGSRFEVAGAIVGARPHGGRRVTLDVRSDAARLDDVLRLIVDGREPPLSGAMRLEARVDIRPGPGDIVDRVWADGRVSLGRAHFASGRIQDRLDELSRRGQGRPGDPAVDNVLADVDARFVLKNAVLTLPRATFGVTGARVQMAGAYGLRSERLDFRGDLRLDAPVSRLTTGVRSWLLRPFDPLFRKHGAGTRVAIRVEGHRREPAFGVEIGRTLRGR